MAHNSKLKNYIDYTHLLKYAKLDKEKNRLDGIKLKHLKTSPLKQLKAWNALHASTLNPQSNATNISKGINAITVVLVFIIFLTGLSIGYGLISYSGQKPINIFHFLFVGVLFPLFTLLLNIIAMIKDKSVHSEFLLKISPAFWLDKLVESFPSFKINFKFEPLILNWLILNRIQLLTISFLSGILVSLIVSVISKDLAFGWSSTLNISPKELYDFFQTISLPWSWLCHCGSPSLELIEKSQFFRLGGKLSKEYISHARLLGNWWQFLVFAIIFWGIFPRIILLFITKYFLNRAIDKSYLQNTKSKALLHNMNTQIVKTQADTKENSLPKNNNFINAESLDNSNISTIIGWAIDKNRLDIVLDYQNIKPKFTFLAGGNNTLEEDNEILHSLQEDPTIIIKSWEPPTNEFLDFIEELSKKCKKINILPIGTLHNSYIPAEKDIKIWNNKLKNFQNIWIFT